MRPRRSRELKKKDGGAAEEETGDNGVEEKETGRGQGVAKAVRRG